jgi:uncharacterized protein YceK
MNRYNLLLAAIAVVLVTGCASVTTQTAEAQQDKTVVTGSRLPAREGANADVKSIGTKEGIDDMMKRGSIIVPQTRGGM